VQPSRSRARGSARVVPPEARIIVAEGNYLLLREAPWDRLHKLWDLTVFLDVPVAELERRLIARWHHHGLSDAEARRRAFNVVQGEIPSPLNPPQGCHFHPRCAHATARCKVERPALREIAPGHFSACHLNDAA
jgi:oligopeptide/dipeptide ABC transporter ATP-binding protein